MDIQKYADLLCEAEKTRVQMGPLSADNPDMTVADAYAVQLANIKRRVEQGEKVIGMKIGITSAGMRNLLGVDQPDYGHLTDKMLILEGDTCKASDLCQPKVEGELAFCLKSDLEGPSVTIADVYNATAYVVPALEIVDSRIKDWKIKFVDTVSDNGSSAALVVGSRMTPIHEVDMRLTGMNFMKNGVLQSSGTTAEVLGNPAAAIAWLANALHEYGIKLEACQIVLAGALTAALPAEAGDCFTAEFGGGLGSVSIKFV